MTAERGFGIAKVAGRRGAAWPLTRMRLTGYATTGRALAPVLAAFVATVTIHSGGRVQAGAAYGLSALFMVPILAWQTKMLLDTEPDVQRRLARVALGSTAREVTSGLLAAFLAALPVFLLALIMPWLLGAIAGPQKPGDPSTGAGVALGFWAHLVLIVPALALGALACRAITRTFGAGLAVLGIGMVGAIVLGLPDSPLAWVAPPVMAASRQAAKAADSGAVFGITLWALVWSAVALAGYWLLRRRRS